jgi:hypothetical protein
VGGELGLSHIEEGTLAESVREEDVEIDISLQLGQGNRGFEKTA